MNQWDFNVSHSLLSLLEQSPKLAYNRIIGIKDDITSRAMKIGRAVDMLLITPDQWDENFEVLGVYKPSGLLCKFVEALPEGLTETSDPSLYEKSYIESGYKIDKAKVIASFWRNASAVTYYQYLNSENSSKTIISLDEYETAMQMVSSIKNSPYAYKYFNPDTDGISQLKITFKYKGHNVKCILDRVIFDRVNRTALPIDLKTTSWKGPFESSYLSRRYFRQGSLYTLALKHYLKSTGMEDYTVLPFQFVVAKVVYGFPCAASIWKMSEEDLNAGMNGGEIKNVTYKGNNQLIEELDWHLKTNQWDLDKESYLNNGVRDLNMFC